MELLVVMAIVAILMGLLFPAVNMATEAMRRTRAKNDCTNITAAVKQYYAEYGKYPLISAASSASPQDAVAGPAEAQAAIDNNGLFNILRAIPQGLNEDHRYNPRRIVFFEAAQVKDVKNPRAGFTDQSEAQVPGAFYDPWGKQYGVALDTNYDNVLDLEKQYQDFGGSNAPPCRRRSLLPRPRLHLRNKKRPAIQKGQRPL